MTNTQVSDSISSSSSSSISRRIPSEWFEKCIDAAASHRGTLYGRDEEVQQLYDIYDDIRSSRTNSQVVLISGVTGIGKTGLARSIEKYMIETVIDDDGDDVNHHVVTLGYFAVGKYDQLRRPEPHCALIEVCTQLVAHIVERGQTESLCQTLALHGIDYNHGGQDLIEMIPSLNAIIKPPPEVLSSSMDGEHKRMNGEIIPLLATTGNISLSTNRWKDLFRLFLRAVSSLPQHNQPVVVLIEDIHWADESSINVLQSLLQDKANHHTLFICTNRTESGDKDKSLVTFQRMAKSLRQNNVLLTHFALEAVRIEAVAIMVADILSVDPTDAEPFASILYKWTKGNIFLTWKCVAILDYKGLLTTDPKTGCFVWDNAEIDMKLELINDMMRYKLSLLSESSQENIKIAACLGSKIDEDILLRLLSANKAAVSTFIDEAASLRLLTFDKSRGAWCFTHDYVQERVYEFIPSSERQVYHYRIGRKLWREFALDELSEFLCLVVGQLLLGSECMKDYRERVAVAKLCLGAGVRAFQMSNFQVSYCFLKRGIGLLCEQSWDDEYDLMMNLHNTAAEVANSLGIFADVHELVTKTLEYGKSYEDTHRARATQIHALGRSGMLKEAIQSGVDILAALGEKIPKQTPVRILFEMSCLRRRVGRKTDAMIMRLPIMTDPKKLAAMEIMNLMFYYTAIEKPQLTPLLGCRMVRMSLDHGLSALSCVGFAVFAATVAGVGQAFKEANRIGLLGFSILQKFDAKPWLARMSDIYFDLVFGWVRPYVDCHLPLLDAYNVGLQSGDTEYALSCAISVINMEFDRRPLPELEHELELLRDRIDLYGLKSQEILIRPMCGLVKCLTENYVGDAYDIKRMVAGDDKIYADESNGLVVRWKYVHRAFKYYLFGLYSEAMTNAKCGAALAVAFYGPYRGAIVAVICGLADVANARKMKQKKASLAKKCSKLLLRWATDGEPRNFTGHYFLLEAEMAAMVGKRSLSYRHYISAIGACKEGKFLMLTAIASERAARSLLEWGQDDLAGPYFREAIASYEEWGATIKVQHLRLEILQLGNYS